MSARSLGSYETDLSVICDGLTLLVHCYIPLSEALDKRSTLVVGVILMAISVVSPHSTYKTPGLVPAQ